jgi:Helix-turn-helix domain
LTPDANGNFALHPVAVVVHDSGMPTAEPSNTLTKQEVCEILGKSRRTIEGMVARGRLKIGYVQGRNGKTGIFDRAEVERLKQEIDTPMFRAVPVAAPQTGPLALVPAAPQIPAADPFGALAAHLAKLSSLYPPAPSGRLWLTLDEAIAFTGLPARFLVERARSGGRKIAVNVGSEKRVSWRFSRDSLTAMKP